MAEQTKSSRVLWNWTRNSDPWFRNSPLGWANTEAVMPSMLTDYSVKGRTDFRMSRTVSDECERIRKMDAIFAGTQTRCLWKLNENYRSVTARSIFFRWTPPRCIPVPLPSRGSAEPADRFHTNPIFNFPKHSLFCMFPATKIIIVRLRTSFISSIYFNSSLDTGSGALERLPGPLPTTCREKET